MGNCLKSASSDDLTLLNGRASDSNRESIDQEPNLHFQVSLNIKNTFLRNLLLCVSKSNLIFFLYNFEISTSVYVIESFPMLHIFHYEELIL